MTVKEMNQSLRGFTDVLDLSLQAEPPGWEYTLSIKLQNAAGNERRFEFFGVTGLSIKEIGGGMVQFMLLEVKDAKSSQLDRVHYKVVDREDNRIVFACRRMDVPGSIA